MEPFRGIAVEISAWRIWALVTVGLICFIRATMDAMLGAADEVP